jgi:hypothetical protein
MVSVKGSHPGVTITIWKHEPIDGRYNLQKRLLEISKNQRKIFSKLSKQTGNTASKYCGILVLP